MPPRTTQQSDRPRVSDRTMVGILPPCCLEALRLGKNDADCDASEFPGPGAPRNAPEQNSQLQSGAGCQKTVASDCAGEVFFLDIPFYRTRPERAQAGAQRADDGIAAVQTEWPFALTAR